MKKLIAVAGISLMCAAGMFALEVTAGLRGTFCYGIGTTDTGLVDICRTKVVKLIGEEYVTSAGFGGADPFCGGGGLYVNFGFLPLGTGVLGVQIEGNYLYSDGPFPSAVGSYKESVTEYWTISGNAGDYAQFMYSFIEIPLLVTYRFPLGQHWTLSFGAGPSLSIPFSGTMTEYMYCYILNKSYSDDDSTDMTLTGVNIGIVGDVSVGLKLGAGCLTFDARYSSDFTSTCYVDADDNSTKPLFIRRGASASLGYELTF